MLSFTVGNLQITWRDILDVLLVGYIFFRIILLIKGTRAVSVIYGLLLIIVTYFAAGQFGLYTLNWLLGNFLGSIFLVVIILFRRDIRKALAVMGATTIFKKDSVQSAVLDELILALVHMAKNRTGALIVIERNVALGDMIERGVKLGAALSRELLITIFFPKTPLHDGAVIIRKGEVAAAACILPLATVDRQDFGTRHRAALGITEESDAVAVVVSEERGAVTVAVGGKLTTSLDATRLKRVLKNILEK